MNKMNKIVKLNILAILLVFISAPFSLFAQDYTILPLGNSITASYQTNYSYRYYLWEELISAGVDFDFIGNKSFNTGGNPNWPDHPITGESFDPDHEGHPGWKVEEIIDEIPLWLNDYHPDIIIIHLGTNDLLGDESGTSVEMTLRELRWLIKTIRVVNPKVSIFLAQIIPTADEDVDDAIVSLNYGIPTIATECYDPNSPIHIVNCYDALDPETDLKGDGVHPNELGEEKMGLAIFNEMIANLPEKKHKWTGATSTNWLTASNWNLGVTPSSSDDVVINGTASLWPLINGNAELSSLCGDLVLEPKAELTIGGDLLVSSGQFIRFMDESVVQVGGDVNMVEGSYGGGIINKGSGEYRRNDEYNVFDCYEAFELVSVKVYAKESSDPSIKTFYWATSDGTIQEQVEVLVNPGEQRINLNFSITLGTDHRLSVLEGVQGDIKLFRDYDADGLDYPYTVGSVASITGSSQTSKRYFYLYDLEYSTGVRQNPSIVFGKSTLNLNGSEDTDLSSSDRSMGWAKTETGSGKYRSDDRFLVFDCFHSFKLVSVLVNAKLAGTKAFYWRNDDKTLGDTVIVAIPGAGEQRVNLNFIIPAGINHRIGTLNEDTDGIKLWRDIDNVNGQDYPFVVGNVGVVTADYLTWYGYNYLYDWEFIPCFYDINIDKAGKTVTTQGDIGIANDLTLTEGSFFSIGTGDMVCMGNDLNMLTDGSGISSFLNNGTLDVRGTARVEQYLTNDVWHYVSSPVSDGLSGVYTGVYMNWWDEVNDSWQNIVATDVLLTPMKGYSAWHYTTPFTAAFEGSLNEGPQSIAVSNDVGGYNQVGNPYPSFIDWDAPNGWTKTNVDNTIYFWSGVGGGGSGNYHYYVGSDGSAGAVGIGDGTNIIPPGQGFMVRASDNGILGVDNDVRVHGDQGFYKSGQSVEQPQIRILAKDMTDMQDETVIRFVEGATQEHDGQFDAFKLFGYNYPQVFTYTNSKSELAVNSLPEYDPSTVISMGFTAPDAGDYSLTLTEFDNFDDGSELFLEDMLAGLVQNLSQEPTYTFKSDPEDDPNRFLLYFGWTTDVEEEQESPIYIYSHENKVVVKLPLDTENAMVVIFDLMGKQIFSGDYSGQTQVIIPLQGQMGHYVVKVQSHMGLTTEKVFIR